WTSCAKKREDDRIADHYDRSIREVRCKHSESLSVSLSRFRRSVYIEQLDQTHRWTGEQANGDKHENHSVTALCWHCRFCRSTDVSERHNRRPKGLSCLPARSRSAERQPRHWRNTHRSRE